MTAGQIEAVARWLCKRAEYMDRNWQLYTAQARELIQLYLDAGK